MRLPPASSPERQKAATARADRGLARGGILLAAVLLAACQPAGGDPRPDNSVARTPAADFSALQLPHQRLPEAGRISSGALSAQDLMAARDAGVQHVINFQTPKESPFLDEAATVTALGMQYHAQPIGGSDDLTPEAVQWLDERLAAIGDAPLLLHCASGNRVGAMMALHAAWHEGLPPEEAIARGRAYGLGSLEDAVRSRLSADAESPQPRR